MEYTSFAADSVDAMKSVPDPPSFICAASIERNDGLHMLQHAVHEAFYDVQLVQTIILITFVSNHGVWIFLVRLLRYGVISS